MSAHGVVAQLVEHLHGMQGVVGSSPISSTKKGNLWTGWTLDGMQHASRRFESDQLHHF